MSADEAEQAREREHERRMHMQNIQAPGQDDREEGTAEILRYLSDEDDLPIEEDDPIMGQLVSKIVSTTNLSADDIKSNKWEKEFLLLLYLSKFPTKEGMHGSDRAWAHDDLEAYREPMDPERRAMLEAFITTTNLALKRSEDGFATKESTRTVNESIVNDNNESSGSGGILGRLGR